ncbi:hypothetical protein [Natronomonas sp. LN261]|nr:hypothetical protein [Natronomonas sp. LN261]
MRFTMDCLCCDGQLEYDGDGEPNTAISCECGSRYAVTVSLIRE